MDHLLLSCCSQRGWGRRSMTEASGEADREGLITMSWDVQDVARGLDALRTAVLQALLVQPSLAHGPALAGSHVLLSEALTDDGVTPTTGGPHGYDDGDLAT